MIAYLKAFRNWTNLETKVDEAGNVLIKETRFYSGKRKPANCRTAIAYRHGV